MLVLSRNVNDSFTIGDSILIRVIEITPYKVKLGIVAPKGQDVLRDDAKGRTEHKRGKSNKLVMEGYGG